MAASSPIPSQTSPTGDLREKTVSGITWQTLSIVGQRSLTLLSTLVLARLLLPSAYGLMGMAMVLIEALYSLQDLGTASALIQQQDLSDDLACSLFWTNVVLGTIGAAVILGIAPAIASLYREPGVQPVLAALSMSFLIGSWGVVQRALLARAMRFRRLSMIQLTASLSAVGVAIVAARRGAGVWSLVAAVTVETVVLVGLYWRSSTWRPRWHMSLDDLRAVTRHSGNLAASNVLDYFTRNADKALIGRFLGAVPLGYYSFAYGLMMYPLFNVTMNFGSVLFPAFARIQGDNPRLAHAYLRALTVIAAITFPLMLGLMATADLVVIACFGARWVPMTPIVIILAPVGMLQSLTCTTGFIYQAKSRTDWMFRWTILEACLSLAAFLLGLRWGATGVAAAYAISVVLLFYPCWAIVCRLLELRPAHLAAVLWPVMRNALVMLAVVLLARLAFSCLRWERPWIVLSATVGLGVSVYAAVLLACRPPILRELLRGSDLQRLPWLRRIAVLSGE